MNFERSSGLLLHITSLGGQHGIGSLGSEAYSFADFLSQTNTRYWQILPIHPVLRQFGYSPYASTSTYAGNPLFINPFALKDSYPYLPECTIERQGDDYVSCHDVEQDLEEYFTRAKTAFFADAPETDMDAFRAFCKKHASWLDDFVLFTACARKFGTNNWSSWERGIAFREKREIERYRSLLEDDIEYHSLLQFFFFEQWRKLKSYCNERNICLIGDVPIYVGYDSADVWASPDVFMLDESGSADPVAGVPPDYFSSTGQRWGNPLYRWNEPDGSLSGRTLDWWIARLKHQLDLVDLIRIDHFRAFESYWAIPASEKTAVEGTWEKGPGRPFFDAVKDSLGEIPLIAEDLGIITEDVRKLRRELGLPGMKILQFAFDFANDNKYLPHSVEDPNCIMYTGTHDNDTVNGWFFNGGMTESEKQYVRYYLNLESESHFHQRFIKAAMMTPARICIVPVQDLLGYDSRYRMNTPGTMNRKNWTWRLNGLDPVWKEKHFWKDLNHIYNRNAVRKPADKTDVDEGNR
ncbi:MAG: 4-alpha-glucanotransferase [Spirochaetota bacterium]